MSRRWSAGVGAVAMLFGVAGPSCTGEVDHSMDPKPQPVEALDPAPAPAPAPKVAPAGPLPTLIMVQAQFVNGPDGRPKPGPARMTLYRTDGTDWFPEVIEDPDSNVFHKGIPWRDGILTIGAMKAMIKHWKKEGETWKATTLWEKSWGGKFDRFRDVELGDVDGDGKDEMVLATHDMGVVAVGDEAEDGTWSFAEFDRTNDTFVHEVEIGDVDGDKKLEFYVTPSERNRASGASQPGGVARYDFVSEGKYKRTQVVQWTESHAKEILVTDLDGDGVDELYAAKEGHVEKGEKGAKATLVDPAKIIRLSPDGAKWTESVAVVLPNEKQCRFLVSGDLNGDGKKDLVAAGMETGLWLLQRKDDGTFDATSIDTGSGGFEHATDVSDLDGDGKLEIYAASEKAGARELRKYQWDGAGWKKTKIDDIADQRITWSLQDGKL
ncbi:MAG: VCBS repeat-containing protein [Myxococcota bacterium]